MKELKNKQNLLSKMMLVSYLGNEGIDKWTRQLVEVYNRLQRRSSVWSYEGHGVSHQQINPLTDLYNTVIKPGEHCIIMNATEPCTMKSLIVALLKVCISADEVSIVRDCNINILTPQQERYYGDLLEDIEVKSVMEAISAIANDEAHFMQNLMNIVLDQPACAKFYFANFFAENGYDEEVYSLLYSAVNDNYKPAITFMNNFKKVMASLNNK